MVRKSCIKVLVRTRPTANFSQDQIVVDTDKDSIRINKREAHEASQGPGGHGSGGMDNRKDSWNFQFNKVLQNTGQETMYAEAAESIVTGAVDGVNGTVMAYGQTGAGKTFTMTGDVQNFKQRGIVPRAIGQVFADIEERPQQEFAVYASFMEIYNEKIFDLLDETSVNGDKDYQIIEDASTQSMQVRGLTLERVANEEEALGVLFKGEQNRIVAEHQLNKQSNRSHSIFTLHVEQKSRLRSEEVLRSKLNLVDLAGSERLKKAIGDAMDDQLRKESRYINKSLTYLEQVVVALTGKARTHIPYRQTKLTNVLKDSLGGNCNTALIACIWGEAKHIEESISTLKLAQRMMRVENQASANVQSDPSLLLKRYERQIRELKQELMMHDALANRSGVSYDDYTADECRTIAQQVRSFVDAAPDAEAEASVGLEVQSVRQVQECFRQFKMLVQNVESVVEERLRAQFTLQVKGGQDAAALSAAAEGVGAVAAEDDDVLDAGDLVGEHDPDQGFALGRAAPNSRPKSIEAPPSSHVDDLAPGEGAPPGATAEEGKEADQHSSKTPRGAAGATVADDVVAAEAGGLEDAGGLESAPNLRQDEVPVDREQAFKVFSQVDNVGRELHRKVQAATRLAKESALQLQAKRRLIRDAQADLQDKQAQIESIRAETKADEGKDEERIIDEEEFELLRAVKDLRKSFRALRDTYDAERARKDGLIEDREAAQSALLKQFQAWHLDAQRCREEKAAEQDQDVLDDDEQFDQLQLQRVQDDDPESVAFFKATKAQRERARRKQGTKQSRRQ